MSFCSPPDTLILDSCVQEHERLDLCLKLLCGLLSKWWPWAAHTSPDLAMTPHKVLGPSIDGRGIPTGARATRMRTGLS